MARQIKSRRRLSVVTNGIFTTEAFLDVPEITVHVPGGFLYRDSMSLVGRGNREFIEPFHIQKGFLGAKGFTMAEGLIDANTAEVAIKRGVVACAKQVVAVIDGSKWGKLGFASFASLDQIDCIITDDNAPPDMVTAVQDAGVQVIIA